MLQYLGLARKRKVSRAANACARALGSPQFTFCFTEFPIFTCRPTFGFRRICRKKLLKVYTLSLKSAVSLLHVKYRLFTGCFSRIIDKRKIEWSSLHITKDDTCCKSSLL